MKLEKDKTYSVKVIALQSFGVIVEMEDKTTELVHISNLANMFVKDVAEFASIGDTYEACCIEGKKRPLELSFKHLDLKPVKHVPTVSDDNHGHDNGSPVRPHIESRSNNGSHRNGGVRRNSNHTTEANSDKNKPNMSFDEMLEKSNKVYQDKMNSSMKNDYSSYHKPNHRNSNRGR